MSTFYIFIIIFLSMLTVAMGIISVVTNGKALVNRLFCVFSISLALWSLSNFLENCFDNFGVSLFFLNLDFFLASFVFFFAFLFLFNFPQSNKKFNSHVLIFFIPTLIISYLLMTNKVIKDVVFVGGKIGFGFGPWFWFYALVGIVSIFSGIIFQFIQYRKSSGIKKAQIRYVLFGGVIYSSIILVFNLFLQNYISSEIFALGNFSVFFWVFCIFYAITRYHLMDIKIILRLGTIFTFLLATIIFVYTIFNYFVINFLGIGGFWGYAIPSFFITIGFLPLKNFVETITDKIFFRRQYKFSTVINEIEGSIHHAGLDLDKALEIVNKTITSVLHVKNGAILILIPKDHFISRQVIGENMDTFKLRQNSPIINYLNSFHNKILVREDLERNNDGEETLKSSARLIVKELDKNSFALAVPIKFKDKLIGVYLLGEKKSRDSFTQQDLDLLRHVAWEMSFAIENAKSYEELRRLDEAKSNFISVVSHQLRTPVTIGRCNLELCFDAKITAAEKNSAVTAAYEGIVFLGRQLDQLMTVLELEERGIYIKKEANNIATIMADVVEENKISLQNKKIKLDVKIDKNVADINCDRNKIKNVLNVLLVNAISYSFTSGHVDILIESSGFNGKRKIVFSVSDNGVGVSEASKSEMFKKFFRGQEAISMLPNGFGLGLFISEKIVNAHGGDIWFENKEHGATFYFSLPA